MMIKRTMLMYLVDQVISHGSHDLYADVLRPYIASGSMKIMGYEEKGYYRRIETIRGYFNFNMDLLKPGVRKELFGANPVYTKTRDSVPTIYRGNAKIKNSLIADGCVIDGEVENCVLFRGVTVAKGAKLKNCVIMQDGYIEEDVELENVIFDKAVTIRSHSRLVGPGQYPIVIGKNITL
jgi:glucose-1-phosphate adenylyltransferase